MCGKYRLFARLGGGGQAEVFLALVEGPASFTKLVVVKKLRPEMVAHPELVAMFIDEARLAARLNHPNIVHTYEVGASNDSYFIAMEYLDGQPLNRLKPRPNLPPLGPSAWARVMADVLAGLHYAHELRDYNEAPLGIVHRDVSPHNIFITYEGVAKLVDFGVAKAALNNARTETGVLKGKASYMAPEQMQGRADRRSDIFSAGIVLWEAIAGRKLFTGDVVSILQKVLHEEIPRVTTVVPDCPPQLAAIVARAVEKDVEHRYQTADEMREALETYLVESNTGVRQSELGRWLLASFSEKREALRRQVQATMEGNQLSDEHFSAVTESMLPHIANSMSEAPSASGQMRWRSTGSESQLGVQVDRMPTQAPRGGRSRTLAYALLATVPVLGAGVALFFGTRAKEDAAAHKAAAGAASAPAAPAAPAANGLVELTSEPPGALVTWNGRRLGTTPLKAELPPGEHTLLFSHEHYQTEAVVTEVGPPGTTSLRNVPLRPAAPGAPAAATAPAAPRTVVVVRPAPPPPPPRRGAAPAAPPPVAPPPAEPGPAPAPPPRKIQVVEDEAPKKIDVIP